MVPINTYGKGTFFFSRHSSSMTTVLYLSWASASQNSFCYVGHLLAMRSFFFHIKWSHLFSCKNFVLRNSVTLYDLRKVHPLWCQGLIKFSSQIKKKKIKPLICVGTDPRVPVCFPFIPAGRSHLVSENMGNWAEYPAQQTVIGRTDNDGKVGWICLHLENGQITWTKRLFYFMENL